MDNTIIIFIIVILILLLLYQFSTEQLCVNRPFGSITDVPASRYVDANMALAHSTSLGQRPLGDPRFWLPNRSPITQGQWGLYQPELVPLDETQNFDRQTLTPIFQRLPVYTEKPLPPQCTPLN